MRQVGVIAAAARVALGERERLAEDHALARRLAEGLAGFFPDAIDLAKVETNIIVLDFPRVGIEWPETAERLSAAGIKANPPFGHTWRLVTHRDIDVSDVDRLLEALS
jgi:threonine aldolase